MPAEIFPPTIHMLRDMRFTLKKVDGELSVRAPVTPDILNDANAVRAGYIATLIDVYAARRAVDECMPDWVVTSSLSFHMQRAVTQPIVGVRGNVLRFGRSSVVYEVEVFEENVEGEQQGEACGGGLVAFSRLAKRDDNTTEYPTFNDGDELTYALPDSGFKKDILNAFSIRLIDAATGLVEADVTEYNTNRLLAIQGGVIATIAEYAAEKLLQSETGKPFSASDIELHYLSLGKAGPVKTRCKILRQSKDSAAVQVQVYDAGADDRLMTVSTVTLGM